MSTLVKRAQADKRPASERSDRHTHPSAPTGPAYTYTQAHIGTQRQHATTDTNLWRAASCASLPSSRSLSLLLLLFSSLSLYSTRLHSVSPLSSSSFSPPPPLLLLPFSSSFRLALLCVVLRSRGGSWIDIYARQSPVGAASVILFKGCCCCCC